MKAVQNSPKPSPLHSLLNRRHIKYCKSLYARNVEGQHGTITIASLNIRENGAEFTSCVETALLLMGNVYPRGYQRIRRELDYILDTSMLSIGEYNRALRTCRIDFGRVERYASQQTDEWKAAYLACVILHEATHGSIYSWGIPYTEATRARIERLCVREEERFVARLDSKKYTARLVPEFDETLWATSWKRTRKQEVKELFALLWQEIREEREAKKRVPKPAVKSIFTGGGSVPVKELFRH